MDYLAKPSREFKMSTASNWPLPNNSIRYLIPKPLIDQLALSILSRGLYPSSFGKYVSANKHHTKRHNHTDNLIIFCFDGVGQFSTSKCQGVINKGDVLFLPKGIEHQYKSSNKEPWSIYWVHIEGHLFEQFMDFIGVNSGNLILNISNQSAFIHEFEQLLETRNKSYQLSSFILASNIIKKMFALFTVNSPVKLEQLKQDFNLSKVTGFMEENISQKINLQQIADSLKLSKFYFAKQFLQHTGVSPIRYFLELKIKHACKLLDESNISVKDVALKIGYDDPYYFSRLFKKIMGLSPTQYRQSQYGH